MTKTMKKSKAPYKGKIYNVTIIRGRYDYQLWVKAPNHKKAKKIAKASIEDDDENMEFAKEIKPGKAMRALILKELGKSNVTMYDEGT